MKVACEACGARYAIPDAKIRGAGRTFKITCRQCNEGIMVQGIAEGDAEDAVWHFALGRERRGPVDTATIAANLADGTLTAESLVWRQGMAGWEPLGGVAEFAETSPAETTPGDDDTTLVSRSELHAAHAAIEATGDAAPEPEAEPAAEPEPESAAEPEPEPEPAAEPEPEPAAEAEPEPAAEAEPEPEPEAAADSILGGLFDINEPLETSTPVHERHDTSVLFSLDDLASATAKGQMPGMTLGEDGDDENSGLIDVRATRNRSGNRRRTLTQSPFDDDAAPIARRSQEGPSIAVPVIKRRANHTPLILAAAVILGGGAFAAVQMMGTKTQQETRPTTVAGVPATATPAATDRGEKPAVKTGDEAAATHEKRDTRRAPDTQKSAAATAGPADPPTPTEAPAKADEDKEVPMTAAERRRQRRLERRERARAEREARRAAGKSEPKREATAPKPEPTPARAPVEATPEAAPKPAEAAPKKDLNALLAALNKDKAGGGGGGGTTAAKDTSNLPKRLSSSKLRSTLRTKRGTFAACYKKMTERPPGGVTVNTSLVVAGSGSVKSVRITSGGGASAAVLRCISSALKRTKFPPFASAQMPVNYPIVLR